MYHCVSLYIPKVTHCHYCLMLSRPLKQSFACTFFTDSIPCSHNHEVCCKINTWHFILRGGSSRSSSDGLCACTCSNIFVFSCRLAFCICISLLCVAFFVILHATKKLKFRSCYDLCCFRLRNKDPYFTCSCHQGSINWSLVGSWPCWPIFWKSAAPRVYRKTVTVCIVLNSYKLVGIGHELK